MNIFRVFLAISVVILSARVKGQGSQRFCANGQSKVEIAEYGPITLTTSPSDPSAPCTFLIRKNTGICQFRLDFNQYISISANSAGDCEDDRLTIKNSATIPEGFTTCGDLTGQHMYLTFGDNCDTIEITPKFSSMSFGIYDIRVTPIPCSSNLLVPSYCLQSYNATKGTIKSFDYSRQQQNSQQYTVCIDSEEGKSITWKPCSPAEIPVDASAFHVGTSVNEPTSCSFDWVTINGDKQICGSFPSSVTSQWKPFLLNVNFDDNENNGNKMGTPGTVTNAAACQDISSSTGGIFVCTWDATTPTPISPNGTCQCDIDPIFTALPNFNPSSLFGPPPDINNVGFCLNYDVQS